MPKGVNLAMDSSVDLVVAVTDGYGNDAAKEVQILTAIGVPDVLVFRVREDERFPIKVKHSGK
jgi:hypothetical protein